MDGEPGQMTASSAPGGLRERKHPSSPCFLLSFLHSLFVHDSSGLRGHNILHTIIIITQIGVIWSLSYIRNTIFSLRLRFQVPVITKLLSYNEDSFRLLKACARIMQKLLSHLCRHQPYTLYNSLSVIHFFFNFWSYKFSADVEFRYLWKH